MADALRKVRGRSRARGMWGAFAMGILALVVGCTPVSPDAPATRGGAHAGTPTGPARGGTFTEAGIGDARNLQPLILSDATSIGLAELQYSAPLVRLNPDTLDYETKYGAAESFEVSSDGLQVTYKLKPNLVWSDGRPISADDYTFTWAKMMDPKVDYPFRAQRQSIEGVTAPDNRTLVFKLKEPFCPAVAYTNINPIPKHVFENVDINDNPANIKPTVGSGPFLLQEWTKDDHLTFVANERFYLGRPNLDRYVFRIVKDQTVAYSMLKTGEVDQAAVQAQDFEEMKSMSNITPIRMYPAGSSWVYVAINMRLDFLKDVRVRQALQMAVDRQKIVDRVRLGHARVQDSIYTRGSWAYSDDITKAPYDLERAKRLLDDAGWRAPVNDPNGIRQKEGKSLRMRIIYNAGNKDRETIATVMQADYKRIGVDIEVLSVDSNEWLNRQNSTRDFDLIISGWSSSIEPHGSFSVWRVDGTQNSPGFANPRVDELFGQAAVVPGCRQADRAKVYGEIQKLVTAEAPYIFLYENEVLYGLSSRLVTNELKKLGFTYRLWEWYSKTGK